MSCQEFKKGTNLCAFQDKHCSLYPRSCELERCLCLSVYKSWLLKKYLEPHEVEDDQYVGHSAPVDILEVVVGPLGQHQPVAFLLLQAGSEGEGILPPGHVAGVVGDETQVRLLVVLVVPPGALLVVAGEEVSITAAVEI